MSLLWTRTPVMPEAIRRKGMAWNQRPDEEPKTPISVRKAGYAGVVGDQDWQDQEREMRGDDGHDDFDDDLYDASAPEPTEHERRHYEEHGEYPEDYFERHDEAYGEAKAKRDQEKADEDRLDHDDPALMNFVGEHGSNHALWQHRGTLGMINIKDRPVYATQTHVAKEHLDRYKNDPDAMSYDMERRGGTPRPGGLYHGDEYPMLVTHQGRLHVTEGHHRVANALMNGEPKIHAWHFNLDQHPEYDSDENEDDWMDESAPSGEAHHDRAVERQPQPADMHQHLLNDHGFNAKDWWDSATASKVHDALHQNVRSNHEHRS